MKYLFFLLIFATHSLGDGLSASTFSATQINSVKVQACTRLAALTAEQTIKTPRGPRFDFDTGDSQVEVVLRPSFPKWRAAIVTMSDRTGLPTVEIRLARGCKIIRIRQITRRPDNKVLSITDLGRDFLPNGNAEIQDPPHRFTIKPIDRSPGTPRIAIVDTGVNYTLPEFQKHIAVGPDEHLIGYDFWDDDHWPYDSDPRRSAFFPLHHGSTVFSVLGREASPSTIAIYRFPAEQMCQLADLVQHIAKTPVRVVNMSMGSNDYEDWRCFEEALAQLPDLLFVVSAGNNGRDIDTNPVYPASLELENMIVVSSADAFGRLGQESNYGKTHVDLLVPAEKIEVIDHRGARAKTGGTSYAAPRITALLGRYLVHNPSASTKEMTEFLRSRAIPGVGQHSKYGWIPDPRDDFGF